jgi:glycosyltransferase involved in cell wall biosynthesis
MRVLILHNRYQIPGGEDVAVCQEEEMLAQGGADVGRIEVNNDGIVSARDKIQAMATAVYAPGMRRHIAAAVARFRPDILHVHNFFPRLSPSVYRAAAHTSCAVVQTLHNYRLLCPNAQLLRNNAPCHDCLGKVFAWPGVVHGCYRKSVAASGGVAAMSALHRVLGTWNSDVDQFIVLTEFARDLFVRFSGIAAARLTIKPNFVRDPGLGEGQGGYALYVGRLSEEKGLLSLIDAALREDGLGMPLRIAGAGPLESVVVDAAGTGRIEFLGAQHRSAVLDLMKNAAVLVFPSIWYEGFPMVIVEAFACGLPVVAGRLGAMAELIENGVNGLLIAPGNAAELQGAVRRLSSTSGLRTALARGARKTYLSKYSQERNLQQLLAIYTQARDQKVRKLI